MRKLLIMILGLVLGTSVTNAQNGERIEEMTIAGQVVTVLITEEGDSIIIADLKEVNVTSMKFRDNKQKRHYYKMRYYAAKVYPFGMEAIKLFKDVEAETEDMKNRKKKKHIKNVHKEMKEKFEDPLKSLTRTQGYILIKMIERELDQPCFDVVKNLRGGFTASYWNQFSKVFGYDLKSGYNPEDDPVLEMILNDMDMSYEPVKKKTETADK